MLSEFRSQPPPAFTSGGYIPDSDNDPSLPDYNSAAGSDIWERFLKGADASIAVADSKGRLVLVKRDLEKQSKDLAKHRESTSKLFESIHRRSAFQTIQQPLNVLRGIPYGGSQNDEKKNKQRAEFEASHQLETQMQEAVSALEKEKSELQRTIDANLSLAREMDQEFEFVSRHAPAISDNEEIRTAKGNLTVRITSYNKAEQAVLDFQRGQVTAQHAHHYYNTALQCLDAVRGGIGPVLFSGISEVSKNQDYKEAVVFAGKAQVCFSETIKVVTPYVASMPSEILSDFNQLQEMGLLQASKIYDLMYGWKGSASDTAGSVKLMFQKQENVFASLTRFTVWVQTYVPVVESEAQNALSMKIAAQKKLVQLWAEQCKTSS